MWEHREIADGTSDRGAERRLVGPRALDWLEVAAFVGLLVSYIWLWQGSFTGSGALIVVGYFGLGAAIHRRHGETAAALGIGFRDFGRGLRQAGLWIGPMGLLILAAGAVAGGWHFPRVLLLARDVGTYIVWGTMQQYGLLCVLYRRLDSLLPGGAAPIAASGLVFSFFHIPNPFLMPVTLALGALSAWLYRRVTNLPALGIAHGVVGVTLTYALPASLTLAMRVGPGMFGR